MENRRKQRLLIVVSVMTGIIFLMGALDFMESGKLFFGAVQLTAGLLNLLSASPLGRRPRWQGLLKYGVLLLNILVAITIAIDYIQAGKQYIQYVWILVAVISTIALIVQRRKEQLPEEEVEN